MSVTDTIAEIAGDVPGYFGADSVGGLVEDAVGGFFDLFTGDSGSQDVKVEEPTSDARGSGLTQGLASSLATADRNILPGVLGLRMEGGKLSKVLVFGKAISPIIAAAAAALVFWQRKKILKMIGVKSKKQKTTALAIFAAVVALRWYQSRKK